MVHVSHHIFKQQNGKGGRRWERHKRRFKSFEGPNDRERQDTRAHAFSLARVRKLHGDTRHLLNCSSAKVGFPKRFSYTTSPDPFSFPTALHYFSVSGTSSEKDLYHVMRDYRLGNFRDGCTRTSHSADQFCSSLIGDETCRDGLEVVGWYARKEKKKAIPPAW